MSIRGVGQGGGLAGEALRAALARQAEAARAIAEALPEVAAPKAEAPPGQFTGSLTDALAQGLEQMDGAARVPENLPLEMARGEVTDLHEIVARLKKSDLTVKFALEIRNKLIDAYREVMRMSV